MKIYKGIIFAILSAFLIGGVASCESLEDTYSQFIGDGETTYIGKADSIKVRGGLNRVELEWLLLSDPKVTNYKVFWNSNTDSVFGDVVKTDQVDTVRLMFDDMEENYYQFDIYLYDDKGNSSVRSSAIGRVYGDAYLRTLMNRTYTSTTRKSNDLIIDWMAAEKDLMGVELEYMNSSNVLVEKFITGEAEADTLFNFPVGGTITYRSVFLPEEEALDLFYTDETSVTINK